MKFDFLLVFRNLYKNKTLAFINALGLSIGISACLLIYLVAGFELSFDKFQPDRDRIFRVYTQYKSSTGDRDYKGIYAGAVDLIRNKISGIEAFTHFFTCSVKVAVANGTQHPKAFETNNNFVFAGPDFFSVFPVYKWLEGNPESALRDPYHVVLTEGRARLYFGNQPLAQLIGKELIYQDSLTLSVAGIVADIDENTDFIFTDFISYSTAGTMGKNRPFSFDDPYTLDSNSQGFIKVSKSSSSERLTEQFRRYDSNKSPDDAVYTLKLQPLSDLHFNTDLGIFDVASRSGVRKSTIQILILLALALLTISVINFINLATAQSSKRAKEVGVRKILGSSRWKLIRYFLMESFVLTLISVGLSIGLSWVALGYFKEFIPRGVALQLTSPDVLLFLLICLIGVPILAGAYPAAVLSAYQPAYALKNITHRGGRRTHSSFLRKGLTVFQFFVSQILIIVTIVVAFQIRYMIGKDLGFTTAAIVTFRAPLQENVTKKLVFRNRLAQIEGVEMVSMQSQPPSGSDGENSLLFVFESQKEAVEHWVNVKYGDANYLNLYDIRLIAGNNFVQSDSAKGYIINERICIRLALRIQEI